MLSLCEIKGLDCPRMPALWGGVCEARANSFQIQAHQPQYRLDFNTKLEEWMRKESNAAVRMQSCFRGLRVRQAAPLRVPYGEPSTARACAPEARGVVPPPPPDPPATSQPSGSPSEPGDSTAEVRAVDAPNPNPNP